MNLRTYRKILAWYLILSPVLLVVISFYQLNFFIVLGSLLQMFFFVALTLFTLIAGVLLLRFELREVACTFVQIILVLQLIRFDAWGFSYWYQLFPLAGFKYVDSVPEEFNLVFGLKLAFVLGKGSPEGPYQFSFNFIPLALIFFVDRLRSVKA